MAAVDVLDHDLDFDFVAEVIDRHAEAVWAGLIAAALGWDAYLVRTGRRTLSQATRCPAGAVLIGVTLLHFADLLGRLDPFNAAAHLIARRTP